ncbi:MAG: shikimate kinase [Rhodobacteraceae bacterium]|nr:shikimate kinase [Paracoccaceae bacterium]
MASRLRRSVVLVGMMGAGKSAVGAALARLLGAAHMDSDEEIERAAQESIPDIFARYGESLFRDREAAVIARLLDGPPVVLSVGGGAFQDPQTRARITDRGIAVWLDVPADVLWARVKARGNRPLLETADPRGTLERLLETRRPVYAQADLRVPYERGSTVARVARRVEAALDHVPGVLTTGERGQAT